MLPRLQFFVLLLLLWQTLPSSSAPLTSSFQLEFNTSTPLSRVDPRYVAYTMDWWPSNGGCPYTHGWGPHSNALDVDLKSPKLRLLVKALGPSILRIGGTRDKVVQYSVPGAVCEDPTVPCLNTSRWDELHEFAAQVNAQIVFGLSYPMTQTYGQWNASQATALLRYSQAQNYSRATTMYGYELGEELSRFHLHRDAFHHYVQAYHDGADLLHAMYTGSSRPLLMGPCPGMSWPTLDSWFPAFLNATRGALDVASYHSYNQIQPNKLYLNFTIPTGNLSTAREKGPGDTGWQAAAMNHFVEETTGVPLWLGEGGPHNGCGGPGNISSTFASSFAYLDTLGGLARLSHHRVVARQALVGGQYELLQCTTTQPKCGFEPQPDYWVALLWRRLMGTIVLEAPRIVAVEDNGNRDWKDALRFHVHCAASSENGGALTVAFSNVSPNQTFAIRMPNNVGDKRIEYILKGHGGFQVNQVELNGEVLRVGNSPHLPPLEGRTVICNNNPLVLSPATLGFVVFPQANAAACKTKNGAIIDIER